MEEFKSWLLYNKNYSKKVSVDIISRIKRALSLLGTDSITSDTLEELEKDDIFKSLSVSVKSQIRRAVRLYIEYNKSI